MQLLDDDPWRYLDRELADDRWLAPPWLHPECVDACTALTFGTCCKRPGSPLARQLNEAATGLEEAAAAARLGPRDEIPGPRLARRLAVARKLLGGIQDRHPVGQGDGAFPALLPVRADRRMLRGRPQAAGTLG